MIIYIVIFFVYVYSYLSVIDNYKNTEKKIDKIYNNQIYINEKIDKLDRLDKLDNLDNLDNLEYYMDNLDNYSTILNEYLFKLEKLHEINVLIEDREKTINNLKNTIDFYKNKLDNLDNLVKPVSLDKFDSLEIKLHESRKCNFII